MRIEVDHRQRPAEVALRTIYGAVIRGLAEGDQNRLLQQRLLTSLDDLSAARQERLSIAENYVSVSQWTLVVGLGIVLLFVVTLNHITTPLARKVAVAAVSDRPSTAIMTCSAGPWKVWPPS